MTDGAVGDIHGPGACVQDAGTFGCVVIAHCAVGNVDRALAGIANAPASAAQAESSIITQGTVGNVHRTGAGIENTGSSCGRTVAGKAALAYGNDSCGAVGNSTPVRTTGV